MTESGRRERLRDDQRSELGESCYEGTIGGSLREKQLIFFFFCWMRELIREKKEIK